MASAGSRPERVTSMNLPDYQRAFAARIRDPRAAPRPRGVPARRMKVYEDLLFNNVEGFLLACFPVCRAILGARRWRLLARAFFRDHACHAPYFRQIPEEFLKYLQDEWPGGGDFPAFLPELAHYEWVELELDTSDADADLPAHDPAGDLLAGRPLLNPVSRLLAYRWPVHRLSPRHRPVEAPAEPTFIVAWRDAGLTVRFSVVTPASARLIELIRARPDLDGGDVLDALARELGGEPAAMRGHGRAMLDEFRRQGVLLGARL